MSVDNPFTTAVGSMPPRFAGRQNEKDSFSMGSKSLTQGNPRNLAFVGDYGTGKTVLLKEFSSMAKDVFCITFPCYQFENYAQFFNFLIDTINRKIRESKSNKILNIFRENIKSFSIPLVGGGIEFKEDDPAFDPMNRMIGTFESVYKAVDQPIILFFDDFQYYLKTIGQSEVLKQAFTVLTQELEYDIMLTICGDLTTFEGVQEPHEPIARFFEPMKIEPLSRDEIDDAINTPLKSRGCRFTDEAIDRTHELSQGRAYYVQLCAHYGLNEAHTRQVTPEDVSTGLRSVLNRLAIERFDKIYNGVSPDQQTVLQVIARSDRPLLHKEIINESESYGVTESSAKMSISRLRETDVLMKAGNKYQIREKLLEEYVRGKSVVL
ncbi:MAG TPA: ATP-binding protein [Desulfobacteria bacterium]|nr:ATP-binding protein [Desulfobacteria bacterium]